MLDVDGDDACGGLSGEVPRSPLNHAIPCPPCARYRGVRQYIARAIRNAVGEGGCSQHHRVVNRLIDEWR